MEKIKLPDKLNITVSDSMDIGFVPEKTLTTPLKKFTGRVGYTAVGPIKIDNVVYNTRIYVFVSPLIIKKKKSKMRKSRISKSGKFKSMRHLIETLCYPNEYIKQKTVDAAVKKEYPNSAYVTVSHQNPLGSHWPWYKGHIIGRGRFVTMTGPAWSKGKDARRKKQIQKRKLER